MRRFAHRATAAVFKDSVRIGWPTQDIDQVGDVRVRCPARVAKRGKLAISLIGELRRFGALCNRPRLDGDLDAAL